MAFARNMYTIDSSSGNCCSFYFEMLFCSTVIGLPLLIPPMVLIGEVFEAWNSVLSGTAVSMVMKYADNIVKILVLQLSDSGF
ncbi:uncharacterized protein [Gossypium hirsutum]|uniref:Uncharacterized protein isoform X5 n=1 Tax=Gossypium hirsutum TaxID=3635 RepID=A0ABM3BND4_GOSHI|nr:uncharacterized protein LOC107959981 isoform X5 [Gossypium hirsutum]